MTETVDGVVVGEELAVPEPQPVNLFGVQEPEQVVEKAASVATALAAVVRKQKLATKISGREHVRVEGWTLLGSMLGVFPVCVWTRKLEDGWEARVEARTRDGAIVGASEAECLRSESKWKTRDDYALRSMAQTRATSKALRAPLGFVMTLAGFDATPAEEMPSGAQQQSEVREEATRIERLKERLGVVCSEADAKRDAAAGTTATEMLARLAAAGQSFADLDETQAAELGVDLRDWMEVTDCEGSFADYVGVKF